MTQQEIYNDFTRMPLAEQMSVFNRSALEIGYSCHVPGRAADQGFDIKITGRGFGEVRTVQTEAEAHVLSREPRSRAPEARDEWLISLWLKGYADVDVDGRHVRFAGDNLELRTMAEARNVSQSRAVSVYFFLPREAVRGINWTMERISKMKSSARFHPLLARYLRTLHLASRGSAIDNGAGVSEATIAMVRACALQTRDSIEEAMAPILATQFEIARQYIETHLWSPSLTTDQLMEKLHLSKRHLYKLFEVHGGVERYIRQKRLTACFDRISRSDRDVPILDIAEKAGFSDPTNFSRQFRSFFGCRPSEAREALAGRRDEVRFVQWLAS
ncbi:MULTISPECIES: helix-turn-helix domain-containing protein [unclassified Rhizobium]|uniref:helix-turn-helix domain-containing protein n=1 Tax=unclassified Rhizobium TaxID=2613769 RepID=UPI000AE4B725|nr:MULTISPECIES: helix-turn-helix domain-containing protein [unclassified Rhizobium]